MYIHIHIIKYIYAYTYKYTPIVTGLGQIYADSVSDSISFKTGKSGSDSISLKMGKSGSDSIHYTTGHHGPKILKSRILDVRRRSPHQNESFFTHESDFQGPEGSKTPKTHISSKSISWTSPIAYKTPAKLKIMPVRVPPVPRMPWKPLAQYIYIYIYIYI